MNHIPVVYLASYFLSLLGNSIASIALPLIVLQTTGSVLGAGAVAAASAIPAVLAYNKLQSTVSKQQSRLEGFADEFSAILSRQIDERLSLVA